MFFDLETTGFAGDAEIVQLAAKAGHKEFSANVLPVGLIASSASAVTRITIGCRNGKRVLMKDAGIMDSHSLESCIRCNSISFLVGKIDNSYRRKGCLYR